MDSLVSNTYTPCTNAHRHKYSGTSHLGDADRSNVLRLVRLQGHEKEGERERKRAEGEVVRAESAVRVG